MGYTHYYSVAPTLAPDLFAAWVADVGKLIAAAPRGLIAGPLGTGQPQLTPSLVSFNGASVLGSRGRTSIMHAQEVMRFFDQYKGRLAWDVDMDQLLGSDLDHETFHLPRTFTKRTGKEDWMHKDERGFYFHFTKTARKPYDIIVTAALIALQYHLPEAVGIGSDGNAEEWQAGLAYAQETLDRDCLMCPPEVRPYREQLVANLAHYREEGDQRYVDLTIQWIADYDAKHGISAEVAAGD